MEAASGEEHEQCGATRGVSPELAVTENPRHRAGHIGPGEIDLLSALEAPAPQQTGVERREERLPPVFEGMGNGDVYRRLRR
jgi:hypothetical protein